MKHSRFIAVASPIPSLLHVLVIEDDPDMRALLARTLERQNVARIIEAATAEDALEVLRSQDNEINFILCDCDLPGMSGLEFCRQLKAARPIMPVLMMTGRDDIDSIRAARDAGLDGYLLKPIGARELLDKITSIVSQTWANRSGPPSFG